MILVAACLLIAAAVGVIGWSMVPSVPVLTEDAFEEKKKRKSPGAIVNGGPTNLHEAMLARSASERVVSPMITRLQSLASRMTPEGRIDALHRKAVSAGKGSTWKRSRLVLYKAIGLTVGVGFGILILQAMGGGMGWLMAACFAALGYFGLDMMLNGQAKARQSAILTDLADIIDQISISVQAGLGFEAAIARSASSTDGPLTDELKRMMNDIRLGSSRANAFEALAERAQVDDLSNFVRSISAAEKTGVSISKVLEVQADEQRERRRQRAEERAMKMPVMLVFPLCTCILPPLFIVLLGPAVIQVVTQGFGG